ncbi:MAG: polyprenyl synthetase family protein [Gammaproteobacteria bacterium AqS3]|nr:polyprenyl synthetase family protein [Gammaproteobacteria bacterium AqS3]
MTAAGADLSIEAISAAVAEPMRALEAALMREMTPDIPQAADLGVYLNAHPGKRLRPLCALLAGGACGADPNGEGQIQLACAVELLHTATLLHDDVVDDAGLRRGVATANAIWSNAHSVLLGDYLYSRAFFMMAQIGDISLFELFSRATHRIASGELHQLLNVNNSTLGEDEYRSIVRKKTGELFAASCTGGALIARADAETRRRLGDYGMAIGEAFQIIDDLLDYVGDADKTGKNIGADLREGKFTLPLIRALQQGGDALEKLLLDGLRLRQSTQQQDGGGDDSGHLRAVIEAVHSTDALEYTQNAARRLAEEAVGHLAPLPGGIHKDALQRLAQFAVMRDF